MGTLLGHVINMAYKLSFRKMLNLLPPTLLFLEVCVLKVFLHAVCGAFGGTITMQNVSQVWEGGGQGVFWNPLAISPCRGALLHELGIYRPWRALKSNIYSLQGSKGQ